MALNIWPNMSNLNPLGNLSGGWATSGNPQPLPVAPPSTWLDYLDNIRKTGQDIQSQIGTDQRAQTTSQLPTVDITPATKTINQFTQGLVNDNNAGVQTPTGGGMKPPTPTAQPLPQTPVATEQTEGSWITDAIPKASASDALDQAKMSSYMDELIKQHATDSEIKSIMQDQTDKGMFNLQQQKQTGSIDATGSITGTWTPDTTKSQPDNVGILWEIGQWIGSIHNIVWGVAEGALWIANDIWGMFRGQSPEQIQAAWDVWNKAFASLWVDQNSLWTKIGQGIANIGAMFTPLPEFEVASLGSKIAEAVPLATKYAPKMAQIINNAIQGVAQGEVASASTTWKPLSLLDTVTAGSLWAAAPTIVDTLGKANSLLKTWLMLPWLWTGNIKNIINNMKQSGEAWDISTKASYLAQWMLDKGVVWGTSQLINKLWEVAQDSKNAVDSALSSISATVSSPAAHNILDVIKKEYANVTSPQYTQILNSANQLSTQSTFTPSELNEVKRMIDDKNISPFATNWYVKSGTNAGDLASNRTDLRKQIENVARDNGVTNIWKMNNDTSTAMALQKSIQDKHTSTIVKATLAWLWGAAEAGLWYEWYQKGGPSWAISAMLWGLMLYKGEQALTSKAVTTRVASFLDSLWKAWTNAIDSYITQKRPLTSDVEDKLTTFVTNEVNNVKPTPVGMTPPIQSDRWLPNVPAVSNTPPNPNAPPTAIKTPIVPTLQLNAPNAKVLPTASQLENSVPKRPWTSKATPQQPQKQLMPPTTPPWTSFPRTDVSAESMRPLRIGNRK